METIKTVYSSIPLEVAWAPLEGDTDSFAIGHVFTLSSGGDLLTVAPAHVQKVILVPTTPQPEKETHNAISSALRYTCMIARPPREALVRSKARLFVGQLEPYVTEQDLFSVFSAYGNVLYLNIVRHSTTVTPNEERRIPTAFIWYETTAEADAAIAALHNNFTFTNEEDGKVRLIQVSYADKSPECTAYGKWQKVNAENTRKSGMQQQQQQQQHGGANNNNNFSPRRKMGMRMTAASPAAIGASASASTPMGFPTSMSSGTGMMGADSADRMRGMMCAAMRRSV